MGWIVSIVIEVLLHEKVLSLCLGVTFDCWETGVVEWRSLARTDVAMCGGRNAATLGSQRDCRHHDRRLCPLCLPDRKQTRGS